MFISSTRATLLFTVQAAAYLWVVYAPGVDSSSLPSRAATLVQRDSPGCPFNADHEPGFSSTEDFPYLGAKNGSPGTGKGGIQVPAPGDVAHVFKEPNPQTDIRGPCPALNALANHGFIAHDGITTYKELMDAQQNVFNVGFDLATVLAIAGVGQGGDLLETKKLSIGCDASSRTSGIIGGLLGDELGLNGHNHFESDTSLTRNDYYLSPTRDNYSFNSTLFTSTMAACDGECDRSKLSVYRKQRYMESKRDNGQFFFGPIQIALYAAAAFVYDLFGPGPTASESTLLSFFGATKDPSTGSYIPTSGESFPSNWTNRLTPYGELQLIPKVTAMYLENPVPFGFNSGPNNFVGLNFSSYIQEGELNLNEESVKGLTCALYLALGTVPSATGEVLNLPVRLTDAIFEKVAPFMRDLGCPNNYNDGDQSPGPIAGGKESGGGGGLLGGL
ncbi:hypothetical protein CBER1_10348 [Cercospora berteroae]|uniref:Heme haloperoxidase family profile domain-containing protein n=1 Tax=Cercospora berteroae TaxID=357750 RepID=A0A2S6BYG2_9PEZI|nr:hypothetical protein CBER1_10348 [Cercospora berteroae]